MCPASLERPDLSSIEAKLADSVPFGSARYISGKIAATYAKLLSFLAEDCIGARILLERLDTVGQAAQDAVFRDSIVRRTIEDGVCKIAKGIETIEQSVLDELLSAAAENAKTAKRSLLNESARCVPFEGDAGYGYIWTDDQPNTLAARRFREEILKRLPGLLIRVPTKAQIDTLLAGARLAEHVAPRLGRSAMSHNFMVVIGEFPTGDQFNSLTMPGLPGVIFLSPNAVLNIADTAEAFFHEALHLKFLDIDYIHPLFVPGFRQESSPRITPVWHNNKPGYGNWPVDRLLTSMHVYLALVVYLGKAGKGDGQGLFDPQVCAGRASQCKIRATWLFETAQNYLELLSPAGKEFVALLGAELTELKVQLPDSPQLSPA